MSYIINNSRGDLLVVVPDGTINTTATSVSLIGQGVTNFGTAQNENFVFMLENFADTAPPVNAITGQLWYDTGSDKISAYSLANTWVALASEAYVQAQKISPDFTGTPTAPTAANATNTTQIATTAFVQNGLAIQAQYNVGTYAPLISPALTGAPTAPTAVSGTANTQIATTEFVTVSPTFTGAPIAPTAANATSNTQIATTAFVQNQKNNMALTGNSTAITAAYATNTTQIATTAFVQGEKVSPAFTGVPTAPTAALSTSNTQIATTAFVSAALGGAVGNLGTMATQNANNVTITGGSISIAAGGTGATTAAGARTNLGLGSIATQNANNVTITGGAIVGISPIAVADGGTAATTASAARTNLGLGTMATQNSNSVDITGGNISAVNVYGSTGLSTGGNVFASNNMSAIGNVNANGNISAGGTVQTFNGNITSTFGSLSVGGNVIAGSFGNILGGSFTNVSVGGNITGANVRANGTLSATSGIYGTVYGTLQPSTALGTNYGGTGVSLSGGWPTFLYYLNSSFTQITGSTSNVYSYDLRCDLQYFSQGGFSYTQIVSDAGGLTIPRTGIYNITVGATLSVASGSSRIIQLQLTRWVPAGGGVYNPSYWTLQSSGATNFTNGIGFNSITGTTTMYCTQGTLIQPRIDVASSGTGQFTIAQTIGSGSYTFISGHYVTDY